jgi:uncharacterized membrane protein YczE
MEHALHAVQSPRIGYLRKSQFWETGRVTTIDPVVAPQAPVLARMTPVEQLRAGRLPLRLTQLFLGLVLYGVTLALMIRAGLGNAPWDVLHQGIARHVPLSIGAVLTIVSVIVLLLWIPLREVPGLGTIANAVVLGISADATLAVVSEPRQWWLRVAMMVAGLVGNAVATAYYIGAQLGPGPRDGLMTGLHRRTGIRIGRVRTALEVSVVAVGWLLGGTLGVGTLLYAFGIGPLVQRLLPRAIIRL